MSTQPPPGRATTPESKRRLLDQIFVNWQLAPSLRLGQLLSYAISNRDLFYEEDVSLLEGLLLQQRQMQEN